MWASSRALRLVLAQFISFVVVAASTIRVLQMCDPNNRKSQSLDTWPIDSIWSLTVTLSLLASIIVFATLFILCDQRAVTQGALSLPSESRDPPKAVQGSTAKSAVTPPG
jgi:hypothetical protein